MTLRSSEIVKRLIKLAVIPYGLIRRDRRPGLVILAYHRVGGGTNSDIDIPAGFFMKQMAHLHRHCRVVSMDAILDGGAEGMPGHSSDRIAVTFDDGSEDIYRVAYPVLRHYGIHATVYLSTRYVDAQEPFDFGGYASPSSRPAPLTWEQIREMISSGLVTVGSHGHSHLDLAQLSPHAIHEEVARSRKIIEDRLGIVPRHFAYTWGRVTPQAKDIVGRYFSTAVRGGCAKNTFGQLDRLALWRRPVQSSDGLGFFRLKLDSYLDGEEWYRQLTERAMIRRSRTTSQVPT